MPYFIYNISLHPVSGAKILKHIDTMPKYKEARERVRQERITLAESGSQEECRMVFAKNDVEAEKLLSAPRDDRVIAADS